jgi:hypothetical protein
MQLLVVDTLLASCSELLGGSGSASPRSSSSVHLTRVALVSCRLQVVVFDVDETLWPFWVDTHTSPPYSRDAHGCSSHRSHYACDCGTACRVVRDSAGTNIRLFEEAATVLQQLRAVPGDASLPVPPEQT